MAALATTQKEMMGHITERMEQLSQQVSGKSKEEGKQSANKGSGEMNANSGINRLSSLQNYVPKTLKFDFPRYDGLDDPMTWVCRAEKYFFTE